MSDVGLSGGAATRALAALAVRRVLRGRALWVAAALLVLPLAVAGTRLGLHHDRAEIWQALFAMTLLILPIVPSILIASSLADELEDKTAAYLWSRALPRWSIVTGKLVGLAPITAILTMLSATAGWMMLGGPTGVSTAMYLRGVAGLAAGAIASGTIAAMWATLMPRQAVAVSIAWLLFIDLPVGNLGLKVHYLSASFGATAIAGLGEFGETAVDGIVAVIAVVTLATTVAIWRIRRME